MDIAYITAKEVRTALARVRSARSLAASPLTDMSLVRSALRDEGIAPTDDGLEWALGSVLFETVAGRLALLRGVEAPPAETTPDQAKALLAQDFQLQNLELEAWGALWYRYLCPSLRLKASELAEIALPSHRPRSGQRLFQRRVQAAVQQLTGLLRDLEADAARQAPAGESMPLGERVVVEGPRGGRSSSDPADELLSAVQDPARMTTLTAEDLSRVTRLPAADLQTYRLRRVAAWLQPQHRLDQRFVSLTLLIDQGETVSGTRWQEQEQRYSDLGQVLSDVAEPATVVLGPPGSGKTTLLRRLELDMALMGLTEEDPVVTYFVPLSRVTAALPSTEPPRPLEWLQTNWRERFPELPPLRDLLDDGRVLLFLDALNEIPHSSHAEYARAVARWKELLHDVVAVRPGNRVVFSCRSLDYSAPLSSPDLRVPQVRIEPLSDDQIREFLRVHSPRRSAMIFRHLKNSGQLELARTPFMLLAIVAQARAGGGFGSGRAAMLTGFVRSATRRELERDNPLLVDGDLLTQRDCRRVVWAKHWRSAFELPSEGALFPRLTNFAYGMQARSRGSSGAQVRLPYDEACVQLECAEAAQVLHAGTALGVLEEDVELDEVQFAHQLFQEYFAGRKMAAAPDVGQFEVEWRADTLEPSLDETLEGLVPSEPLPPPPTTGWEETVQLAASMADDAAGFVRTVADANLPLAARCAAQPDVQERLAEQVMDELRWALVGRSRDAAADLRVRIDCGLMLGRLGDPRFERRSGPHGEYLLPPMVTIPEGDYPIGGDGPIEAAGFTYTAHLPRHHVSLGEFGIGRFAVTNAEWACFMAAEGYDDERWWDTADARAWRRGETTAVGTHEAVRYAVRIMRDQPEYLEQLRTGGKENEEEYELWSSRVAMTDDELERHLWERYPGGRLTQPDLWRDERFNNPAQPVVGITWFEARAYCRWLSAQTGEVYRLPTEVECEAATRGIEGRRYAYGDRFESESANTAATHIHRPTPVGVFPTGDTPEGACDLSGNTNTQTLSLWGADPDVPEFAYPYSAHDGREDPSAAVDVTRVARGADWCSRELHAAAYWRTHHRPDIRTDAAGLRLAKSLDA